jgi:uncharacterized protein (TIGR03435 family)
VDLGHGAFYHFGDNRFEAHKMTMALFCDSIWRFLDRPVVDMTGLKGAYDFVLEFTPEDYRAMLIRSAVNAGVQLPPQALQAMDAASGDSFLSAVQAVGLKLEPRRAPVEVLVVDRMEKTPTEN